jgi:hypothetical protein
MKNQAFFSLFFGRRFLYPHFLQLVARMAFRALQRMHILTFKSLASASGNLAILQTPRNLSCIKGRITI